MPKIEKIIDGLRAVPEHDFTCDNIYQFLSENPVEVDSISPYFFWSDNFYTRNLIYKDERFELMAVCWERGQQSRIHNHAEQQCWMTVPIGKLRGQNFRIVDINAETGFCKLAETEQFDLSDCLTAKVELEEPIHQILNLAEFNERAVSVHVYSKPIERCFSYCDQTDTYKEISLHYTSIKGKLCDGVSL